MDITSLNTVIPNGEGLLALKHFFDLRTVKEPSSETLLRLAELVLTINCFSFAGNYFKQINGVTRHVSFRISFRWLIHIINPVDKTQLSCYTSHRRSTTVSLET